MSYRLSFASLSALRTWQTGQTLERENATQLNNSTAYTTIRNNTNRHMESFTRIVNELRAKFYFAC